MAISPNECYTDPSGRELVTHGNPEFPIACYNNDCEIDVVPPHWHAELELYVIKSGSVYAGCSMHEFLLQKGSCVFINANILHSVKDAASHSRLHSLVFSPSLIGGDNGSVFWNKYLTPLLHDIDLPYRIMTPDVPWQCTFIRDMERAWRCMAEEPAGYEVHVRNALSEALLLLCQNVVHGDSPAQNLKNFAKEQRLKQMMQFVQSRYSDSITLESIAAAASVSSTECMRCFREGLKISPMQYVRRYRLHRAAEYLRTTDWPVSEVGRQCGFQEMGYFAAQFRNMFGSTPSQYRKKSMEQADLSGVRRQQIFPGSDS